MKIKDFKKLSEKEATELNGGLKPGTYSYALCVIRERNAGNPAPEFTCRYFR